ARCADMLRPMGWFVHIGPMNNWVDHGFYQFSPTFWFDWLSENDWEISESVMVRMGKSWRFSPLPHGRLGTAGELDDAPYMHYLVARKLPKSRSTVIPTQSHYSKKALRLNLRE